MDSRRKRKILDSDDDSEEEVKEIKRANNNGEDKHVIESDDEVKFVKHSAAKIVSKKIGSKKKKRDEEWLTSESDSEIGSDAFSGSSEEASGSEYEVQTNSSSRRGSRGGRASPVYYYPPASSSTKAPASSKSRKSGQFSNKCIVDTYKPDRARFDGLVAAEMDDFIVGDDEVELESDEDVAAERRERRKSKEKKQKKQKKEPKEPKVDANEAGTGARRTPQSSASACSARKQRVVDDDSDDDEPETGIDRHVYVADGAKGTGKHTPSSAARRGRTVLDSDSEEPEAVLDEINDSSDSSDSSDSRESGSASGTGSCSESSSEESVEGHALYWRLDAKLDAQREETGGRGSCRSSGDVQVFCQKSAVNVAEAFHLYVEMLALYHLFPGFAEFMAGGAGPGKREPGADLDYWTAGYRQRFQSATKQIEDVLCTYRESALGSSAWGMGSFVQSLQERPFHYAIASHSRTSTKDAFYKCDACRRSTHKGLKFQAYFYGCGYDAKSVWTTRKWASYMPPGTFLHEAQTRIADFDSGVNATNDDAHAMVGEGASSSSSTVGQTDPGFFDARLAPKRRLISKANDKPKSSRGFESDYEDSSDIGSESSESDVDPTEIATETLDLSDIGARRVLLETYTPRWLEQSSYVKNDQDEWVMGVSCHYRTEFYHVLLHYKIRLLMSVRAQLLRVDCNMSRFSSARNCNFFASELRRYEKLLRRAKGWNMTGRSTDFGTDDIWEGAEVAEGSGEDMPVEGDTKKSRKEKKRKRRERKRERKKAQRQSTITDAFDSLEGGADGKSHRTANDYKVYDDIVDDPTDNRPAPLTQSRLSFVSRSDSNPNSWNSSNSASSTPSGSSSTHLNWSHSKNSRALLSATKHKR